MVKTLTHQFFSFTVVVAALKLLHLLSLPMAAAAALVAFVSNGLIDGLGHERRGGYVRRTSLTHSLTGASLVAVITSAIAVLALFTLGYAVDVERWPPGLEFKLLVIKIVFTSFVSCFTHLLADLPTEGGIFYKKRRVSLGHFKYNGPINALYLLCSAGLLLWTFA